MSMIFFTFFITEYFFNPILRVVAESLFDPWQGSSSNIDKHPITKLAPMFDLIFTPAIEKMFSTRDQFITCQHLVLTIMI